MSNKKVSMKNLDQTKKINKSQPSEMKKDVDEFDLENEYFSQLSAESDGEEFE